MMCHLKNFNTKSFNLQHCHKPEPQPNLLESFLLVWCVTWRTSPTKATTSNPVTSLSFSPIRWLSCLAKFRGLAHGEGQFKTPTLTQKFPFAISMSSPPLKPEATAFSSPSVASASNYRHLAERASCLIKVITQCVRLVTFVWHSKRAKRAERQYAGDPLFRGWISERTPSSVVFWSRTTINRMKSVTWHCSVVCGRHFFYCVTIRVLMCDRMPAVIIGFDRWCG